MTHYTELLNYVAQLCSGWAGKASKWERCEGWKQTLRQGKRCPFASIPRRTSHNWVNDQAKRQTIILVVEARVLWTPLSARKVIFRLLYVAPATITQELPNSQCGSSLFDERNWH